MTEDFRFKCIRPEFISDLEERLFERRWLIHSIEVDEREVYSSANYLQARLWCAREWSLVLDVNIFQFIVSSVKKGSYSDQVRNAIGLVAFCQVARIEIDPTIACYEKAFQSAARATEVVSDLGLFHRINNTETTELANFALGFSNSITAASLSPQDDCRIHQEITRYKKLCEWGSFYLMILKLIQIKCYTHTSNQEKLRQFLIWCMDIFRFSLVATVYAVILFGRSPSRKMMKFRLGDSLGEKRAAASNMTWDLFLSSKFFEKWVTKGRVEYIFASDDRAFRDVMTLAIKLQQKENFAVLREQISEEMIGCLKAIHSCRHERAARAYMSESWSREYRSSQIRELETAAFGVL